MTTALIVAGWIIALCFARLLERTWWAPGSLLALLLAFSAIGTAVFAPEYYESLGANAFLQALVLATVAGSVVGQSIGRRERRGLPLVVVRRTAFIAFGTLFSVASLIATLQVINVNPAELTSPLSIMRAAQSATRDRYTLGFDFPAYYNVANALVLTYGVVAAAHFTATRRVDRLMLLPLFVYGFANLLITTRSPILFLLIMMTLSSAYAHKLLSPDDQFVRMFSARNATIFAFGAAVILGVFFLFQVLRFGEGSNRDIADIWLHLRRWPWGSLPGFSIWFDGLAANIPSKPAGFYTFMGLYDNFGVSERVVGGYSDYVFLTPGEPGNIYTAFRGLVMDFGFVGAFIGMAMVGLLGGIAVRGRLFSPVVGMSIFILVSTFIAFSFVVSAWAFTSNVVAVLLIPLLLPYFCGHSVPQPKFETSFASE